MNQAQLKELLLQSLEHEMGGVEVYEAALKCAVNHDLREEWEQYHEETRRHVEILRKVCQDFKLDPDEQTPGREVLKGMGEALVSAMEKARAGGNRDAAQLVACECIVLAETKDHLDWELIGKCAEKLGGHEGKTLQAAYEEVEDQEDIHLYHTKGWCRELWIQSLRMKAVVPPPEERKDVKSATEAAKAVKESEKSR